MAIMHNAPRTLYAAYLAVSLAVAGITLQAMWDSFVNGMAGVEVLSESGTDFKSSQSTLSVLSTSTSSPKAIVCSAISEDESFAVLVASLGVFTAALQASIIHPDVPAYMLT